MLNLNALSKILVLAAHPDDEIIGCGGSLAKYANHNTTIVYMTSGDAGNLSSTKKELSQTRENEAIQATSLLGIKNLIFLRNPDGFLEVNQTNLIELARILRKNKPNIVYTHSSKDFHPDHRATFKLTKRALFMAGSIGFQEAEGEPWTPNVILTYEIMTPFQTPHYNEDITQYMTLKLEALKKHTSQRYLGCEEWVEGLNRYRGGITGVGKYAEAFRIQRIINSGGKIF